MRVICRTHLRSDFLRNDFRYQWYTREMDVEHRRELARIKHFLKFVGVLPRGGSACWLWKGMTNQAGYGMLFIKRDGVRRAELAHRRAHELFLGPIPDDFIVCHSCDNPPCVNPWHLWAGTHWDNNRDCRLKERARELVKVERARFPEVA